MKEINNPRRNDPVEYSKNGKFHKRPITSVPTPETSQNIIFSSHKVTDTPIRNPRFLEVSLGQKEKSVRLSGCPVVRMSGSDTTKTGTTHFF